ncbi:hypothetical protein BH20BAC1_BH20BAC1_27340 [soil metagenome]
MLKIFFLFAVLLTYSAHAQFQLGVFAGLSDYNGDLLDKPYRYSQGCFGLAGGYQFSDRFTVRAEIARGKIKGKDEVSYVRGFSQRNLNFQSSLSEFSMVGEYNLFNLKNMRWTPFAFTGIAVYHYNPYTFDQNNEKFYLKPLSTEGQGLDQYPERKPYSLTRLALPIGGGLKYAVNDRMQVAAQIGLRVTNNDYLDDVSTTYVDQNDLLAARGPKAVELSYRADELPGGNLTYPPNGASRGRNGKIIYTDFYYFSGVSIILNVGGNGDANHRGSSNQESIANKGRGATHGGVSRQNKRSYGCPQVR